MSANCFSFWEISPPDPTRDPLGYSPPQMKILGAAIEYGDRLCTGFIAEYWRAASSTCLSALMSKTN